MEKSLSKAQQRRNPIRIVLLDRREILLLGLRTGLSRFEGLCVVGHTTRPRRAAEIAASGRPDVALIDLRLADSDGFRLARRLRMAASRTKVVFTSAHYDAASIERALQNGASGLLTTNEPLDAIAAHIRQVADGEFVASREIRDRIERRQNGYGLALSRNSRLVLLSERERDIVRALALGCPLKQAAGRLKMNYKAADHLKTSIMKKLDIHDRAALTRFAVREGLVSAFE